MPDGAIVAGIGGTGRGHAEIRHAKARILFFKDPRRRATVQENGAQVFEAGKRRKIRDAISGYARIGRAPDSAFGDDVPKSDPLIEKKLFLFGNALPDALAEKGGEHLPKPIARIAVVKRGLPALDGGETS